MADPRRRSDCPIACSLDLLGDRWTLLIVRDLLRGKKQFTEFHRSEERIATKILSDRLERLVRHGLAERVTEGARRRAEYRLTAKGRTLEPLLQALEDWGSAELEGLTEPCA